MVQLKTKRTALSLYAVLLVLPTLVLGLLHWYELALDHTHALDAVPRRARGAAMRLTSLVQGRLSRLVEREEERPFYHYAKVFVPEHRRDDETVTVLESPLRVDARPDGILAWFNYNTMDGPGAPVDVYSGARDDPEAEDELHARMSRAASELAERLAVRQRLFPPGPFETVELPLVAAAVHQSDHDQTDCVAECARYMVDHHLPIDYSPFHLQFYRDPQDGTPRVVATRRISLDRPLHGFPEEIKCLDTLEQGFGLVQGFFVDPAWLFRTLPDQLASQVLDDDERFLDIDEATVKYRGEEFHADIWMVSALGLEAEGEDEFYGLMKVAIDMGEMRRHFRSQSLRYLGLAAMLAVSLATGMVLLLRSVSLELEQASRTENFVAAVTHELRTPLSAIRLHGEMLLEGWASDEATRAEYHRRILRETNRLSTLVERVLVKSKLSQGASRPVAGNLNDTVERLALELTQRGSAGEEDLELDLEQGLPQVWMTQEALSGILGNLVENARKYAPYDPEDPESGPIRIRTGMRGGRVVLEVSDRGPGIPDGEREKIFDAFYRAGHEATRSTQGTGLGLHLVRLHAESIGGTASVHENPGGGALFRIRFRSAD